MAESRFGPETTSMIHRHWMALAVALAACTPAASPDIPGSACDAGSMLARDRAQVFCVRPGGKVTERFPISPPRLAASFSGEYARGRLVSGPDGSVAAILAGAFEAFDEPRVHGAIWVAPRTAPGTFRELLRYPGTEVPSTLLWSDDGSHMVVATMTFEGRESFPRYESLYDVDLSGKGRLVERLDNPGGYARRYLAGVDRNGWLYSYLFFEDSTGGVADLRRTHLDTTKSQTVDVHLGNEHGEGWPFATQIEPRMVHDASAMFVVENEGRDIVRYSLPRLDRTVVRSTEGRISAWEVLPSPSGDRLLVQVMRYPPWPERPRPTLMIDTTTLEAREVGSLGTLGWGRPRWSADGRYVAVDIGYETHAVVDTQADGLKQWPRVFDQILGWVA